MREERTEKEMAAITYASASENNDVNGVFAQSEVTVQIEFFRLSISQ